MRSCDVASEPTADARPFFRAATAAIRRVAGVFFFPCGFVCMISLPRLLAKSLWPAALGLLTAACICSFFPAWLLLLGAFSHPPRTVHMYFFHRLSVRNVKTQETCPHHEGCSALHVKHLSSTREVCRLGVRADRPLHSVGPSTLKSKMSRLTMGMISYPSEGCADIDTSLGGATACSCASGVDVIEPHP